MLQNMFFGQFLSGLGVLFSFIDHAKGLQCVTCPPSASNHECNLLASIETCASNQAACFNEIRVHGGVYKIRKGCSQMLSCEVQMRQNSIPLLGVKSRSLVRRCNGGSENSVCHHCCSYNFCNLAEKSRENGANRSCSHFLPGCRATWWHERGGFLTENGVFLGCHCDKVCEEKGDCCFDYQEICVGVLPRAMRRKDPYGGTTGGEYKKVMRRGGGLPLLRCYVCEDASSNEDCNRRGIIMECLPNQRSCVTKTRVVGGRRLLSKRCSHTLSCEALQSSTSCVKHGVCYSCCGIDYCNFFQTPHKVDLGASCLTAYPGYPQCKRHYLSSCEGSRQCAAPRCRCDSECVLYNDCCADYNLLCRDNEEKNLEWIFDEIERNQPRQNEENLLSRFVQSDVPVRRQIFPVIENRTFELDAVSTDVEHMKTVQKQSIALLAFERAQRGRRRAYSTAQVKTDKGEAGGRDHLT